MTDHETEDLTAELTLAVSLLNETLLTFRPQVDAVVRTQIRVARRVLVAIGVAVLVAVLSVGTVLYQRQTEANSDRSRACHSTNDARAVSRQAWRVAWDAIDKTTPDSSPAQTQIDTVRAAQQIAYAPIPCD